MGERRYKSAHNYDEVVDFIIQYKKEHNGNSPAYDQIMESCDIYTKSHVKYILDSLAQEGKVELEPGNARSISIPGGQWVYHG